MSKPLSNTLQYAHATVADTPTTLRIDANDLSSSLQLTLKRLFDIVATTLGLLVISPALAIVALLIYITSPGPIFYKSLRIGKDYQPFYMYKFRTMVPDAEKQRQALYQSANLEGQLFKLKHDPRITPIGAFLRKYSIDEFPQLINVLQGQMSLVGPRPYVPEESEMFEEPYTSRFNVLPGMTGPWQVSGRSNLTFQELCDLEFSYVSQWSLSTDLKLLFLTIPSVVLKKGAY